ncbi:MAG: YesL family protein [Halanaerobiales bacterium]
MRLDGPVYRYTELTYNLLIMNVLWIIFSIPIFTMGAATTALFYVVGKHSRGEQINMLKDFWKGFISDFGQSTIVFILMFISIGLLYFNLRNLHLVENYIILYIPFNLFILIEWILMSVYIYPLISRYELSTFDLFKKTFLLANTNLFRSVFCLLIIVLVLFLIYWKPFFFLFIMSIYAFLIYNILKGIFLKYES